MASQRIEIDEIRAGAIEAWELDRQTETSRVSPAADTSEQWSSVIAMDLTTEADEIDSLEAIVISQQERIADLDAIVREKASMLNEIAEAAGYKAGEQYTARGIFERLRSLAFVE